MAVVRMFALTLALSFAAVAAAAPTYVATFHSIGLYWAPPEGAPGNAARVEFRVAGKPGWRRGLDLWFDERNAEYRGSLVELEPGTVYTIRLALASGRRETLQARTWSEHFRVKRVVQVKPGTKHLVIEASDSGSAREGYVVFTAPPGRNTIDQSDVPGNEARDSCIVVKQGVQHIIVRGLVLKNCKRYGVFIERQFHPVVGATTHDVVIEDNEIHGWGASGILKPGIGDDDGAIHCNYYREEIAAKKPMRIVVQRNRIYNPRHGANPWQAAGRPRAHPHGPQAVTFMRCGSNHVFRYNEVYSTNGNHFNDGFGGGENFSAEGFPWADSDIYGNRVSHVYDDAIEAEGANRNVRIWRNYVDKVHTALGNAATSVGPLYVWRNISNRMGGMYNPAVNPDAADRGSFIKAGSWHPVFNGGRAYYFHNTVLQPPPLHGSRYTMGAGSGIEKAGGRLYNVVSRNNIWHIHKTELVDGQRKFYSIHADSDIDADFDLHNGLILINRPTLEPRGWGPGKKGLPVYATSGTHYPDLEAQPGNFSLQRSSPGYGRAAPLANFNDQYSAPDVGAHQSGTPPLEFGLRAYRGVKPGAGPAL